MSTAAISYSSLIDANGEAKDVAKKLDKYADSLHKNVYKKLDKYDGSWSSNLSSASDRTNKKIESLRTAEQAYKGYAEKIKDLCEECKSVDKTVKSDVSTLTASFKERNGIRNSAVQNGISYLFTSFGNSNAGFRWLGSKSDEIYTDASYLKSAIKERYNYKGGKELIKGYVIAVLEVAIAVAGVIVTVATFFAGALTFGAVLVLAAGLVSAAIAFQNVWTNIENEKAAYAARQEGDPATGYRRSAINSYTDYLRSSYMFGDDGQSYHYNKTFNAVANGIDIASFACTVVTLVNSCGKLAKNAYKWATGDAAKLKDIKWGDVFSKNTFAKFTGRLKTTFANLGSDFKAAVKYHDFSFVGDFVKGRASDMLGNLKKEFWDFGSIKDGASSIKNMISIPKNLLSDGITLENIIKEGIFSVGLPSLTFFTVNDTGNLEVGEGGQMQFDFFETVPLSDLHGILDKVSNKIFGNSLFENSTIVDKVLFQKLSKQSNVNISVPKIDCPEIVMPILRVV